MTVAEDTKAKNLSISQLDQAIVDFDRLLEQIQELLPEDLDSYEAVVSVRDYMFRLQQRIHGVKVEQFAGADNAGGDI